MLNSDPRKLRFLGIDLYSRARRRWSVVLTYLAYLVFLHWIAKQSILDLQANETRYYLMVAASLAVMLLGVFRESGPVKSLHDFRWPAGRKTFRAPPVELDERELTTRDRVFGRTLELLILFCFSTAGVYGLSAKSAYMSPVGVAQAFLMLMVFGATWPKAIILWNEPSPRRNEDPKLVQQPLA